MTSTVNHQMLTESHSTQNTTYIRKILTNPQLILYGTLDFQVVPRGYCEFLHFDRGNCFLITFFCQKKTGNTPPTKWWGV